MAGQYAKPRSRRHRDARRRHAAELPRRHHQPPGFTAADREPDPELLLRGYERAALDAQLRPRADRRRLRRPAPPRRYWDLAFVQRFAARATSTSRSLVNPWRTRSTSSRRSAASRVHASAAASSSTRRTKALHLPYEQAQTRFIPRRQRWYNLSTHFPWIGMRTARPRRARTSSTSAASRIRSASRSARRHGRASCQQLIHVLNPQNEPGRLTFIHRFGAKNVDAHLPRADHAPCARPARACSWVCDPMHGNTETTPSGSRPAASTTFSPSSSRVSRSTQEQGSVPRRRAPRAHGRERHRVHRRRARPQGVGPRARIQVARSIRA